MQQRLANAGESPPPPPCDQGVRNVRVESRHLTHKEYNAEQDRWVAAHIRWDMSTAVHPQSPTLSTEGPYTGRMCQHEIAALDTLAGRDWRFNVSDA